MKNKPDIIKIQKWLDENLPYFNLLPQDNKVVKILYNGKQIEEWKKFERFTSLIKFPLDFSSSLYVGVTTTLDKLQSAIQQI